MSVRPYIGVTSVTLTLPIPAVLLQNVTKKGCLVCVRIKYYAFLVDFRPLGCKKQGETKLHILQWRWNVFKDNGDKKIFVLNIVGTIFNNKTFSRLCPKISPSPCPHMFRRPWYIMLSGKAKQTCIHISKLTSAFRHFLSVGPKQLFALAHLGCTSKAGTS